MPGGTEVSTRSAARPRRAGSRRSPAARRGPRRAARRRCAGSARPRGRSRSVSSCTPAAATTFSASATTSGPIPSPPITATRCIRSPASPSLAVPCSCRCACRCACRSSVSRSTGSRFRAPPWCSGAPVAAPSTTGPLPGPVAARGPEMKNRPPSGRSSQARTGGCAPTRMTTTPWVRSVLTRSSSLPRTRLRRQPRPVAGMPCGPARPVASANRQHSGGSGDRPHLTAETYERLQAELEDLTTRGRVEIAQAIEAARALGDLSENGDYHAAKDAQGKMESRIRQLQATARTTPRSSTTPAPPTARSTTGTVVRLRYEGDDEDDARLLRRLDRGAPRATSRWSPPAPRSARPSSAGRGRHRRVRGAGRHAAGRDRRGSADAADGERRAAAAHPGRQGLGAHVVHRGRGRARPALHRPPPGPRGDLAAGLRRPADGRPARAPPRPHRRHGRPQRADHRHRQAGRRPRLGQAARGARGQLRRVRHHLLPDGPRTTRASCTSSAPSRGSPSRA